MAGPRLVLRLNAVCPLNPGPDAQRSILAGCRAPANAPAGGDTGRWPASPLLHEGVCFEECHGLGRASGYSGSLVRLHW